MNKTEKQRLIDVRHDKKQKMLQAFKQASTPQELLQAYATYAGNLEALLDMYEIYAK